MSRLSATIVCDIQLQVRNGFYYAAAFVAGVTILLLLQIPSSILTKFMPVIILSNLLMNTFYFVAGLVLLEKGEGTLWARTVTPLRHSEYLISKVATLTILSLIENLAIIAAGYRLSFDPLPLIAGLVAAAAIYTLAGFMAVSRYETINEYLFPSFLYTLAFVPPFLQVVGLIDTWVVYLHPLQGPLLLAQAAFGPVEPWKWIFGLASSTVWISVFLFWSMRSFQRFIVSDGKQG